MSSFSSLEKSEHPGKALVLLALHYTLDYPDSTRNTVGHSPTISEASCYDSTPSSDQSEATPLASTFPAENPIHSQATGAAMVRPTFNTCGHFSEPRIRLPNGLRSSSSKWKIIVTRMAGFLLPST